ncbi:ATPase [Roseivivax halodurans JCM 10272]|uniref:ATPase n=2 Tax=Roseivivax halodurans TaxID=93683 RepID=X7EJ01_9RHOB|nr:ATPase [Roseivivax halodurans JCM 10272]
MCAEAERPDHRKSPLTATERVWPTAASVRNAVMRIEALLRNHGIGAAEAGLAALALAEVLNNVTEHAYANAPASWIRIDLALDGPSLDLTIADRGSAMPGLVLPAGSPADLDVAREDLPEGGFGWFLIRQLASDIRYVRDGGTNRLTLAFDLPALGRLDGPV